MVLIWQADFYKRTLKEESGQRFDYAHRPPLWELILCDEGGNLIYESKCPQSQSNSAWLVAQFKKASQTQTPDIIQVFRPQSLGLLTTAAKELGWKVEATRRTQGLKTILQKRSLEISENLLSLEQPQPQGLPANLWGDEWGFVSFPAGDLVDYFRDRPLPFLDIPKDLEPLNLRLPSNLPIPGVLIYGGKQSLYLARWLQEQRPAFLEYKATEKGKSGGLILESGLIDRWIIATFEDEEIAQSGDNFEEKKQQAKGLHFLLIQPDHSGITHTGFWLLENPVIAL